jgi:predicted nucleic acid-binding protein
LRLSLSLLVIHFDTGFLIAATVAGSPAHARVHAWSATGEFFGVSAIAWAEYLCGPLDATSEMMARQLFPQPDPFLPTDVVMAAGLFNQSERRSRSLADCMIAAVAIRCGAPLATMNLRDFQPLTHLGLVLV